MTRPTLMDALLRIAEPVVASQGLEIWGIEILQSSRPVIRIFVELPLAALAEATPPAELSTQDPLPADSPGTIFAQAEAGFRPGATIDQCADISRHVGLALEVEDIFSDAYVLEVSSPGLSRTFFRLEQLRPYVGDVLEMTLHEAPAAWPGRKKFSGTLEGLTATGISLLPTPQSVQAGSPREDHAPAPQEAEHAALLCVAWEDIRKINRVHVFHEPVKPGKPGKAGKEKR